MKILEKLQHIMQKKKQEEPKSMVEDDINNYMESERIRQRIDYAMNHERQSFLYGGSQNG